MEICVVDDSRVVTAQVQHLMAEASLGNAVVFNAAEEALCWCLANKPPVVLADFSMPGLDGLEFLKCLKRNPGTAGTSVGIMSGWETTTLRKRAAEAGASGVISKPLDEDEFRAFMLMLKGAALEARAHLHSEVQAIAPEVLFPNPHGDLQTVRLSRLIHEASSTFPLGRVANRGLLRRVMWLLAETHCAQGQEPEVLDAALRRTLRLMTSRRPLEPMPSWAVADARRASARKALAGAALELVSAREPDALKCCAQMVFFSGECWDGSGGPLGMRGIAIPHSARVFSLARRFVDLADARPEPVRMSGDGGCRDILDAVQSASGHEFDPSLVRALEGIAQGALHAPTPGNSPSTGLASSVSHAPLLSSDNGLVRR